MSRTSVTIRQEKEITIKRNNGQGMNLDGVRNTNAIKYDLCLEQA